MKKKILLKVLLLLLGSGLFSAPLSAGENTDDIALRIQWESIQKPAYSDKLNVEQLQQLAFESLRSAYPDFAFRLKDGKLGFPDNTSITFDDGIDKTAEDLLDRPDIFDMFTYRYPSLAHRTDAGLILPESIPYLHDPGRVRNERFFRAMYGSSKNYVQKKLAPVKWLPSANGPTLMVTTVNGVNKAFQAVSDELDKMPELWPYLLPPGGIFNWRVIAGTDRLSVHSFAAAVDINVAKSHYWRYTVKDEAASNPYKNRIPAKIVEIFERHGFIWGGWWYHYDTMHFEYRPELIAYMNLVEQAIPGQLSSN